MRHSLLAIRSLKQASGLLVFLLSLSLCSTTLFADTSAQPATATATATATAAAVAATATPNAAATTAAISTNPPAASPAKKKKKNKKKYHDIKGEISTVKQVNFTAIRTAIPAGFESLAANESTMTDLYYGNQPLGATLIKYSDKNILFLNPKGVLNKLQNVVNPQALLAALSKPLSTNADKVCLDNRIVAGCGQLNPPIVGVIFNPDTFRTDLFINPGFLAKPTLASGILPHSDAGFSYLNILNAVGTGVGSTEGSTSNYNFNSNNFLGFGNARLNASVNYGNSLNVQDQEQVYFNQLNAAYYIGDKLLQGGIISTMGNSFINSETVLGGFAGTSLDTVQDTAQNDGTLLQVFLPTAATVNIYKDGQLLSSQHYQMGYQILNTAPLPNGAYQVVLEIRTDQGLVTRETRYFAKTNNIPPARYPQYYVDAGRLEQNQLINTGDTFPEFSNEMIYGTGFNMRVRNNMGINADAAGLENHNYLTLGTFVFGNGYQVGPLFMVSDHDSRGAGIQANSNFGKLQTTLFTRQVWGNDDTFNQTNPDAATLFMQNLEASSTQDGGSLSYQLSERATIGFSGNYTQYVDLPLAYSYGPTLQMLLMQRNDMTMNLNLTATKTQDDQQYLAQLLVFVSSSHWVENASIAYRSVADGDANSPSVGPIGDVGAYWRNLDDAQQGVQVGVVAHAEQDTQTMGAVLNANNNTAGINASVNHYLPADGFAANDQYSVMAQTHFAYANQYAAVGGADNGDTGIIVYIASPHPGDLFEVYVNDQYVKTVKTDHSTPIFIAPFQTYKVRIRDVSSQFYDYDQNSQTVTLYRGNVRTLTWDVRQKIIVYGKIISGKTGKPLDTEGVLNGIEPTLTDKEGNFQAEVYDDTTQLESELENHKPCYIDMPSLKNKAGFAKLGTLVCKASNSKNNQSGG